VNVLISSADVFQKLSSLKELPSLTRICVNDQSAATPVDCMLPFNLEMLSEWRMHSHSALVNLPAFLQYTGGTTGLTKAAMISHRNVLSSVGLMTDYLSARLEEGKEVFVVTFPFYHVFSIVFQVLMAMKMGATILLYPWVRAFKELKEILLHKEFTVFVGVHTLYKMMLQDEDIREQKFPQAKLFIAGAEHVQPITKQRWRDATGHLIVEGYGLTESSALAVMSSLDEAENDLDAIGFVLPQTDIQLLDDENQVIREVDTPGEICIRGPQVVQAYWNRPEENQQTFMDGWLRTGDIGIRKPNAQYKIVDRKKDMINVSGFNVYPNEVEAVLLSFPGVTDCAAVAMSDEKSGERVAAFVVADQVLDLEKLKRFCQAQLTAYKVPVRFIFIEAIPKSAVGKTLRVELRQQLMSEK
jgi:long-chain acyl-CoA synthetase